MCKNTTMSKAPKKKDYSSSRVASSPAQTPNKESSSLVASASEGLGDLKKSRVPIWPEWNEAEVNAEKWDATKSKDAKGAKGSHAQLFEDPEGRVDLPVSLKVHSWKRPSDYLVNKVPVVVENECAFDLTTANEHLLCSELMRWIISEIYILWKACNSGISGSEDRAVSVETTPGTWRPWEHIYSLCKVVKGHQPLYNPYGKYVLKLYWMGAWRKVTIDDALPFDEENKLLLPSSTNQSELWPMLLAKALIKLANTDLIPGNRRELGEFTIIHTLTGWVPEIIPLNMRCVGAMWTFLRKAMPRFQLKKEDSATSPDMRNRTEPLSLNNKSPEKHKDSAKRKGKDIDQGRKSQTPVATSGQPNHNTENVMVCASYLPLKLLERKTSELGKMADSSEYLRQCGLSQLCSHPVLLTQTRVGPLVAQPVAAPVPRWKLIRPHRQHRPTDEPQAEPAVEKPQEFIEVASPFLNLKLKTLVTEIRSRKQICSSVLASFTEHNENERENITDSLQSEQADAVEPTEVTAEDKKKDERPPSDQTASETQSTSVDTPPPVCVSEKPALQETWVPLEHFTHCFQTLLVFHKPNAYPYHSQKSQYKSSVSSRLSATALSSPNSAAARQSQYPEEKGSYFLVVDSLQRSEILISFSALLHWGETLEEKKELQLRCGVLTVEPFSWKSLIYQLPILSTHTTACKAVTLKLQPGRHVLCFHMRAVLGFHVHLYSWTPFIFGDEEAVMPVLTKESVCFVEQAVCIASALGQVVRCFSSDTERQAASRALTNTHFPPNSPRAAAGEHMKLFGEATHKMFSKALDRALTSQELLAVQALTLQPCLTLQPSPAACSHTHSHTHTRTPTLEHREQPGTWSERSPTEAEERAAVTLQAGLRGYAARRMVRAARPGTKENLSAAKTLQEMWASVKTDLKKHAISLLGYMFSESPSCVDLYGCREDEQSRISFSEYSVTLPDTPNIWALIFREVFFVPKDTLLVAKVYSPVVSALHVINNDTGEEMPKVFHKVEPHIYKSNQKGYTFVAEAHTGDVPIGRWRMCLIGCRQPLPFPARETPVNSFCVKEFKDYYIPNEKYIICRFSVKVNVDVLGTVQFQTSASHVHLRMTVLDHEDALTSATGKGQVIIPVFTFSADPDSEESQEKEDSEETDTHTLTEPSSHTHTHKYVVQVEVLHRSWAISEAEAAFIQTLRHAERNEIRVSPFTTVGGDKPEEVTAPSSTDQSSNDGQKSNTPKSSRKTKEKEKDKEKDKEKEKPVAKPASRLEQALDTSKPHWTLRVVCEQAEAESVCVKRDMERQEQIKALKMAWESADPGRAVKALQSRLQFINKCVRGLTGDGPTDGADRRDSVFQQSPDFQDMNLFNAAQFAPMDYTPYIRRTRSQPLLKDEAIAERQRVERSERIQEFRLQRDMVLERRQQERAARRQLKRRQIQLYDAIQISLWEHRQRVLEAREEFRQRLLVEETQQREEEAAHEALRQMEQEKNQAQATARKSAGKKK
ncbi:androglobin isoform X1 [Alosa sapidissima]|uniref:androglobin isoform X1 n=1 Tax=Alosa sapidissima TaxID=34773 RepID=UPI001C09F14F|nr:androglobin isoform X1 [Alosa sapidissima]